MSRYRRELKSWSKNELIREVERLRAITREHADRPGDDSSDLPGEIIDVTGDPFAAGGVVIDARNAILLDTVNVCWVDADPSEPDHKLIAMTLGGRVNMRDTDSNVLFLFNVDGAAGICSQLFGVADRRGPEFRELLLQRIEELP